MKHWDGIMHLRRLACAALLATMVAVLSITPASLAAEQFRDENLLMPLPTGYSVAYQRRERKIQITEWVPLGQNLNNWTEMVTRQVFFGRRKANIRSFQRRMSAVMSRFCQPFEDTVVSDKLEHGYPSLYWTAFCGNSKTGKPEIVFVKAISGNDSMYVVQKAFKFHPSKAQITKWSRFLAQVMVCDSRLPDRTCPRVK
ncbi:MAG: hypothetical protein VYD64_07485 [Pseudomonadota bacterium]|nr:hypothetical protein [Pseudomonadota bacterium]